MTQPTIGRVVHYTSYGSADGRYKSECRAAVITEVRESDIGLAVLNPTGMFFDRQVREDDGHKGGTWHWPCVVVPSSDDDTGTTEESADGEPEDR